MASAAERRTNKRELFTVTLEYSYSELIDGKLDCTSGDAITRNISHNGLGLFCTHMLSKGQDIKIFSTKISDTPQSATVQWCAKLTNDMYKIGLIFS